MDESEAGPSSLRVARERNALSRHRQAVSDQLGDIAWQAASLERVQNAKRANVASETEEERAVRPAKRRKRDHSKKHSLQTWPNDECIPK